MALWELDGVAIATKIRKGEVTAREATEATLARMDAVNSAINAVVARDDEAALVAADAVDAARADGAELGPMAGVPVTIKENVDQTGCATTNGLLIQKDLVATQDNPVVANLRRAGAVIVGRTNTPAFSLRWFTRNSLHGHTRNPHNPRITPGGSSGGAAAATAAGIGAMGHGTDIGGSIRYRMQPDNALSLRVGADARYDRIGQVGLYPSAGGVRTGAIREDRVDEYSGALLADVEWKPDNSLRVIAGLRGDAIGYRVRSDLAANSGKGSDGFLAPKVTLAWNAMPALELFANYGESFHSNDVRGATINVDPASGDPADRVSIFSRARGAELGARIEADALTASLVSYWLKLSSELVFVGDAGTTEPSDASRRFGVEASLFWKPTGWLTLDGTAAFTNARFRGVAPSVEHIPGSVSNVISGGIHADLGNGFSTSARVRHFGSAPLIEDGSVRSEPTTLFNVGGYWTRGQVHIAIDLLNAFNSKDPDISYFYASRLSGEPAGGVEDRHIHPVEPRQVRATVKLMF